jgi:hypothetical protein
LEVIKFKNMTKPNQPSIPNKSEVAINSQKL